MLNRFVIVAYGLTLGWAVFAWIVADRITAAPDSQLFIFALLGLPPIAVVAMIRFVTAGRF